MTTTRTSPGTRRVRNRRQLIVASAAQLFAREGYHNVAMSRVAADVGVRPSALYRHICGKQELLHEVVHDALATVGAAVVDDDPVSSLARAVLGNRTLGVLWQRESRHLDPQARQTLRAELVTAVRRLATYIGSRQPRHDKLETELLSWALASALMSVSFQRIELPEAEYQELLIGIGEAVLNTDLTGSRGPAPHGERTGKRTDRFRRDELRATATRLFAEQGFAGVSMDDIGAAAGISGPSIYHHFASKIEILLQAMRWGAAALNDDLSRIRAEAIGSSEALTRLVESYTGHSLRHPDVMDLLLTEAHQLPEYERNTLRQEQRAYIAEWVRLLRQTRPDMACAHARVRVQAALSAVNDTARTPHLRRLSLIHPKLTAIAHTILIAQT